MEKIRKKIFLLGPVGFLYCLIGIICIFLFLLVISILLPNDNNGEMSIGLHLRYILSIVMICLFISGFSYSLAEKAYVKYSGLLLKDKICFVRERLKYCNFLPFLYSVPILWIVLCNGYAEATNYNPINLLVILTHAYLVLCCNVLLYINMYEIRLKGIKKSDKIITPFMEKLGVFMYYSFGLIKSKIRMNLTIFAFIVMLIFYTVFELSNLDNLNMLRVMLINLYLTTLLPMSGIITSRNWNVPNVFHAEDFKIKNVDIDIETIKTTPIYYIESDDKSQRYHLIEIDVSKIFENNYTDCFLFIKDAYNPIIINDLDNIGEVDVKDKILVMCSIDENSRNNTVKLDVFLMYKNNTRIKSKKPYDYKYYEILLSFSTYDGVIYPNGAYLTHFWWHKVKKKDNLLKSFHTITKGNIVNLMDFKKVLLNSISNIKCFNDVDDMYNLDEKINDSRKVLMHNGGYGVGKTTYDINSVVNKFKIPIIVSAWKDNYDHDILYLFFDSIRNETSTKKFELMNYNWLFPFMLYTIFFIPVSNTMYDFVNPFLSPLLGWLKNNTFVLLQSSEISFLSKLTIFQDIFTPEINKSIKLLVIYFIVLVVARTVFKRIWPYLIIYKKDHTKVYNRFYINAIAQMLNSNPNYILLVEDIDRLKPVPQNEVFRVISSINSYLPRYSKIFCIISYSRKYNEEKATRGVEQKIDYEEIDNKIVHGQWGANYSEKESMKKYSKLNLDSLYILYQIKFDDFYFDSLELMNHLINKERLNFRTLNAYITSLVSDVNKLEVNQVSSQYIYDRLKDWAPK